MAKRAMQGASDKAAKGASFGNVSAPSTAAVAGAGGYKRGGKVRSKEEKRESKKTERKERK